MTAGLAGTQHPVFIQNRFYINQLYPGVYDADISPILISENCCLCPCLRR
jgi:hypothetical protein